jgi:hypothetical protein
MLFRGTAEKKSSRELLSNKQQTHWFGTLQWYVLFPSYTYVLMHLETGAGGLGIGMDLSGFVETKYAVEFSPSAAKTYM